MTKQSPREESTETSTVCPARPFPGTLLARAPGTAMGPPRKHPRDDVGKTFAHFIY